MTAPASVPRTSFSTDGMPGHEAWDAWQGALAPLFDIEAQGTVEAFRAEIDAFDLRTMILAKMTFGGVQQTGRRSQQLIRRSGLDHYALEFCLSSAGYLCEGRHGAAEIRAGSLVVLDLGQINASTATSSATIALTVPRTILDRHCPGIELLHGKRIGGEGRSHILGDHMLSLWRHLPLMTADEADTVAEATAALIGACLAPSAGRLAQAGGVIDQTMLDRAKAHIDSRLEDPKLSAAALCAAVGTSRSNLYRLFQPLGGVAHYIQERRLRRVHAALRNPTEWRNISELAYTCGFVNAAHFSRAFRNLFGYSPSDTRDLARTRTAPQSASAPAAPENFVDAWLRNLQLH